MTLLSLLWLSFAARAEVVDLEAALAEVAANNPSIEAAEASLVATRQLVGRSQAAYLPSATAVASYTRNSAAAELAFPDFAAGFRVVETPDGPTMVPVSISSIEVQKRDQLGMQIQVQQGILVPTAIPAIRAARASVRGAELDVEQMRRETLFGAASLYYTAVALSEAADVSTQHVALLEEQLAATRSRFEAGAVPELAVVQAELDAQAARQDLLRAEFDRGSAVGQLATLMGRAEADFELRAPDALAAALEGEPVLAPLELEPEDALGARPDHRAARSRLAAAKSQYTAAWASFLPTIGASANYQVSNTSGFAGQNSTWAAGLSVSLPILDRGLRYRDVREAGARVAEAGHRIDASELAIRQEIREAELAWDAAVSAHALALERASLARRRWAAIETAYGVGAASPLEISEAASALRGAELGVLSQAVALATAALDLARAHGIAEPPVAAVAP